MLQKLRSKTGSNLFLPIQIFTVSFKHSYLSDLHLLSVHPHVLLRSLSIPLFCFVISLQFYSAHLFPSGNSALGFCGWTQLRPGEKKIGGSLFSGWKNNDMVDGLCPAAWLWCPNLWWTVETEWELPEWISTIRTFSEFMCKWCSVRGQTGLDMLWIQWLFW